jgi:hypothetical protein
MILSRSHVSRYTHRLSTALACLSAVFLAACGEEDLENPAPDNAEEVITTLKLKFTPQGGGAAINAEFKDADGPGGAAPTQTPINLAAGTTYTLELELLNETVPEDDEEYVIGNEIREEAEEHKLFFTGTAIGAAVTHAYADKESDYGANAVGDDLPVGMKNTVTATAAGMGTLIVTLKHQPPVNGTPVKSATSTIADGGTDLEVTFQLTVQ